MGIDATQMEGDWQGRILESFSHWIALDARLLQFAQLNGGADIRGLANEMEDLRCVLAGLVQKRILGDFIDARCKSDDSMKAK